MSSFKLLAQRDKKKKKIDSNTPLGWLRGVGGEAHNNKYSSISEQSLLVWFIEHQLVTTNFPTESKS